MTRNSSTLPSPEHQALGGSSTWRQGCLLVPDVTARAQWTIVGRGGERSNIEMSESAIRDYATAAAKAFGKGKDWRVSFDKARAKEDAKKADKKAKVA